MIHGHVRYLALLYFVVDIFGSSENDDNQQPQKLTLVKNKVFEYYFTPPKQAQKWFQRFSVDNSQASISTDINSHVRIVLNNGCTSRSCVNE